MSTGTKIEWTEASWNPLTGCTKVSPGCDHCYAETLHERFHGKGSFATVTLHPERLDQPLRWRKPRKVFVNSMSDLFHQDVPDEYIAQVFAVMAAAPQHTYQVLTKRHARLRSLLNSSEFYRSVRQILYNDHGLTEVEAFGTERFPLRNVWLGVSVEDQHWADIRIPALLETPAAVRWISAEPLLGPVDLHGQVDQFGGRPKMLYALPPGRPYFPPGEPGSLLSGPISEKPTLDWIVCGGESGPGARPMHPDWAHSLRDQCQAASIPFLFKQWGAWAPNGRWALGVNEPGKLQVGEPDAAGFRREIQRVGKGKAGRELDGRTWDEYPA